MLRTWVMPSLLMVLERNTHRSYHKISPRSASPPKSTSARTPGSRRDAVGAVLASHEAGYEDAKARLQTLTRNFDVDLETPPTDHPTFISGRTAAVVIDGEEVGVIGEVHPKVLVEHDLEVPVSAFEFDLEALR